MRISVLGPLLLLTTSLIVVVATFKSVYANSADDQKVSQGQQAQQEPPKRKLPKDPLYITDVDLENLYDQWEESDDEKLPPDELPAHKRPPPAINMAQDDLLKDPEKFMRQSKKGKTVMAFVTIANNPTREQTEALTTRWEVGLTNSHMHCKRFVVDNDRAIFVFEDGSLAFEAKDYFVDQPEVEEYSIDGRTWHGRGFPVEYPNAPKGNVASGGERRDQEEGAKGHDEL